MEKDQSEQSTNPSVEVEPVIIEEQPQTYESVIIKIIMKDVENSMNRREDIDKEIKYRNKKYFIIIAFTVILYMVAVVFHIFGNTVQAIEGYFYVLTISIVLFLGIIASEIVLFIKNIRRR